MLKKILAICLMAVMAFGAAPTFTYAGGGVLKKELKKEYKKKIKELNYEGWKISGSSRSLEVALLKHYEKLEDEDNKEIVGEVSTGKSLNLMSQAAINNACLKYASLAGSYLKGRIVADGGINQSSEDGSEEFDRMYQAYERLVSKEIKGEISESFSVVRDKGDGTKEFKTFFIVNEAAASKARIRAWELAQEESEVAQRYAGKVSEFINEGFDTQE